MPRGNRLTPGGLDTVVLEFTLNTAGAESKDSATTTSETDLVLDWHPTVTGGTVTNLRTYWTAPWPYAFGEVYVEGQLLANADAIRYYVKRGTSTAYTADNVIDNVVSGSSVSYLQLTATTANQYLTQRFTGEVDDDGAGLQRDGFLEAEKEGNAGDRITATYAMAAAGDQASHVRVMVTINKIDG